MVPIQAETISVIAKVTSGPATRGHVNPGLEKHSMSCPAAVVLSLMHAGRGGHRIGPKISGKQAGRLKMTEKKKPSTLMY